jgi:predicted RNase H-like nuclease
MAVLGVDACRAGWAGIVLEERVLGGVISADLVGLLRRACELGEITAVGVDMPLGLPDAGRRRADVLARAYVGRRWQSVFLTPVRAAVLEPDHTAASRLSRELTGEGVSRQAFGLRSRILELDAWAADTSVPVLEVHPEVSFTTLGGGPPPHPKKTWAGAGLRRSLLAGAGIAPPDDLGELGALAAIDDVLDAAVVAWSARRWTRGEARCLPDPPEQFSDGHRCAIWA